MESIHKTQSFKPVGFFSRRHKTPEALMLYRGENEARVAEWQDAIKERAAARAALTPAQQIDVLDERLGKSLGAKKERKRLEEQLAKQAKASKVPK